MTMCDPEEEGYVVAEMVDPVKTPSELEEQIRQMARLNKLLAQAVRHEKQLKYLRTQSVQAMQAVDISQRSSGTLVERLLEAGKAATIISHGMPEEAATMFITAAVNAVLQA